MPRPDFAKSTLKKRYILAALWMCFTLALCTWWVIYGLKQIEALRALNHRKSEQLVRQSRMLMWEGGTLFLLLVGGGAALGHFMVRELREREAVQRFLATFSHELKTPLTTIRLQAEMLQEQAHGPDAQILLDRLLAETGRITLQLDNCLALADGSTERGSEALRPESIELRELVERLASRFPQLRVKFEGQGMARADSRALESIFQNLFHNSIKHGHASEVSVNAHQSGAMISISCLDNGQGFSGDAKRLGRLFHRFYPGSGNGIGLYLVKRLIRNMGGTFEIPKSEAGFRVQFTLPAA